ncbi:LLM class flavin-dependent oxidoreductase, partial [Siccirubricoccus sp. KC 17139]
GRLTIGIGAGWLEEEFVALQTAPFAARGKVTDEYILACKALWTEEAPEFAGEHVRFGNVSFAPKPVQRPHPPIWVGGESGPALRRTARLGDAWYPIGTNPAFPLDSLKRYEAAIGRLRKLAAEAGRNPASIGLAYRVQAFGPSVPPQAGDGERRLFSGEKAAILEDVRALRALGVTAIDLGFPGGDADALLAAMRGFADSILQKV